MSRFPWQEAMAAGFGVLRHSSESFWRLTLRELVAATDAYDFRNATPPDRAMLAELMRRFPDRSDRDADRD